MRPYTEAERRRIAEARTMVARLRMEEAIEGLREERLREAADDRAFQQLQSARKRWLEQRQHGGNGLVYKVKYDARIR